MSVQVLDQTDELAQAHPAQLRAGPPREDLRADATLVLHLAGELDMATAPALARALALALDARPSSLALDLRGLTFLDSSGVRVLATAGRRARREGRLMVLRSPCASVLRMLELTGLDRLVTVERGSSRA